MQTPLDTQAIPSEPEKIIAVVQAVARAMEQGNLDAALATYAPEARLVVKPGQTVTGADMREVLKGFIAMKPRFSMPKHEVIVTGDIALHIAPWSMEGVDPTNGNAIKGGGLSLAVLHRQPDGTWLMVMDNPYGSALLTP